MADTPVEGLLARVEELAQRWAIALILARPLERISDIPLEDLAREAPELFAQVIRALASEAALERLLGVAETASPDSGLAGRLAVLAGADDPVAAVAACEALRGVLWDALLAELHEPSARQVADLSDRLAAVCAAVAATLLTLGRQALDAPLPRASALHVEPGRVEETATESPPKAASPALDDLGVTQPREPRLTEQYEQGNVEEVALEPTGSPWVGPPRIEIRDVRGEGPSAWIGSIGRRLERHAQDGLPFAVLLVEVVDIERLQQAGSTADMAQLIGRVEGALSKELRPADLLTREAQGRYWLVTPETDGVGVRMLAERLARSVRVSASDHGAPLEVAIGIAVRPDDGHEAATLAAHADAGVYAARAAGRSIAPADEASS